jgi:plastocyanin
MAAPLRRPSRLALAALLVAGLGVTLLARAGRPASAQAKATVIAGTAQLKWEPANVTIKPGESVTFKVTGGPPHPVASGDGSNPQGDTKFDASACGIAKMGTVGASCTARFPRPVPSRSSAGPMSPWA